MAVVSTSSSLALLICCLSLLLPSILAAQTVNGQCPPDQCMSAQGECGYGWQYCGEGCRGGICYIPTTPADRPPIPAYDMTGYCEHIEDFSGEQARLFTVDYCAGNFATNNGTGVLSLNPECGTRLTSLTDFAEGYFEARLKVAKGNGVVTSFILRSDESVENDEVDLEWVGKDTFTTQSNLFIHSVLDYSRGRYHPQPYDQSQEWTTVRFEYNQKYVAWYQDGKLIRSLLNIGQSVYPNKRLFVQLGIWPGNVVSPEWAGTVDYSRGPYSATFDYVKFGVPCQ